jgi:hypothetical protein
MTILTPFPGTKIYHDGLAKGIIKRDYWKEFAANPRSDFVSPHGDELFTKDELNDLLIRGYRSFYLNPLYVLRRIQNVRSLGELKKKAVAGLKVFNMG